MRARRLRNWMVLRNWAHMRPLARHLKVLFRFQTGVSVHLRYRKGKDYGR